MDSIIFDVDGTLWNSTGIVAKAWENYLRNVEQIELPLTAEIIASMFGQPLPDIAKTNTLTIRRSFSDLPVDLCHFFRFQKGAGILYFNGKALRFPDPEINVPRLRGAASVNETILHHRLNDKPRKILILDSVITL